MTIKRCLCFFASASILFATSGCRKDAPIFSGTVCFSVEHHRVPYNGTVIYHKRNSTVEIGFPQNMEAAYDTLIDTNFGSTACFDSLGLGPHQFAAIAYDELLQDFVKGNIILEMSALRPRIDTILQVSESH